MSQLSLCICDEPKLVHNLTGHRNGVTDVDFNPGNLNQFASSGKDHTLMLWNLTREVRCLKFLGHTDVVTSVRFSSNGSLMVSASQDHTIRLWKPTVRGESYEIKAHSAAVRTAAFSPDDKNIITGSNDKSIKLWDVVKRRFVASYNGHTNWVQCVKFVNDGTLAASCADDKTIKMWDIRAGYCVHTYTTIKGSGNSLDVHSNGHSLAVALSSGSIRIYDIRCKKLLQHYLLHDNATDISWHPSSGFLLTSGKDKNIHVVDVLEGKPLFTLTGNAGEVHCVQFAKTGEYFASGGSDQNILVWKANFKNA